MNNFNTTNKYQEALAKADVTTQVALQPALRFNSGGHNNHSIFGVNLSPNGGEEPKRDYWKPSSMTLMCGSMLTTFSIKYF